MERNKVIATLERCWKHECYKCDWRDGASGYPWSCPLRNQAEKAALELLRDTTNPKGGSCSTCIHEAETGDYCTTHTRCKVGGVCSGYER